MKKMTDKEKRVFAIELATILDAGIDLAEGCSILARDKESGLSEVALECSMLLEETGSFSESLKRCSGLDSYFVKMTEIGEMNGCLDKVYKELAEYYSREESLKEQMKHAIVYPFVLVFMMFVVVSVMYFKVIPVFESAILNLAFFAGNQSSFLMMASKWASLVILILTGGILVFVCVYVCMGKITGKSVEELIWKLPLFEKMYDSITCAKITYALSLFIHSGYSIEVAVKEIPELIMEGKQRDKLNLLVTEMEKGVSFQEAIKHIGLYRELIAGMLTVGLETGQHEEIFEQVSKILEKEAIEKMEQFLGNVEPVLISVLSFMVGLLLLAILMPLLSISSLLG